MKRTNERAIAEFFQGGGEIRRCKAPVRVSEQELFEYLAKCGLPVKVFPGEPRPYGCNGKRLNIGSLLRLANERRSVQQFPPLTL